MGIHSAVEWIRFDPRACGVRACLHARAHMNELVYVCLLLCIKHFAASKMSTITETRSKTVRGRRIYLFYSNSCSLLSCSTRKRNAKLCISSIIMRIGNGCVAMQILCTTAWKHADNDFTRVCLLRHASCFILLCRTNYAYY